MKLVAVFGNRVADLRWAWRAMTRAPGTSAIAILSLALGIGANTAIFSMINALLLRTLPVSSPHELSFVVANPKDVRVAWPYPDYLAMRDGIGSNVPLAATSGVQTFGLQVATSGGSGRAELAQCQFVSGNYFNLLGVRPELGRLFTDQDGRQLGAAPYAVLAFNYWRTRFAGDPGVVGRTLRLNGYPLIVVGVARQGFTGTDPTIVPGVFVPIVMYTELTATPPHFWNSRRYWWIRILGRIPPTTQRTQLESQLTNIARVQAEADRRPNQRAGQGSALVVGLMPGARGYTSSRTTLGQPLMILMGVVGAVLLIACANVANVMLARGASRQRELAVRAALGAGRSRIAAQLLTESLLVAVVGGSAGIALAWIGAGPLLRQFVPRTGWGEVAIDVSPDGLVLFFTAAVSLLTGVLAGVAPAIQATRPNLVPALKDDTQGSAGSSRVIFRRLLVVSQVALSLLLVVAAGLFVRSLANLRNLDPGFRCDRLVMAFAEPARSGYKGQRLHDFYEQWRARVERMPGVRSASLSAVSPLGGLRWSGDVSVDGYQQKASDEKSVDMNAVGPRYFETMGIPLVLGREFTPEDNPAVIPEPPSGPSREPASELPGPRYAIVNETFARKFLSPGNPIGRRLSTTEAFEPARAYEVVGVVRDVRYFGLKEALEPMVYLPVWRGGMSTLTLAVRTDNELIGLADAMRAALGDVDAAVPLLGTRSMAEQIDWDIAQERLIATLAGVFGGLAVLLAAIGLYGVIAYLVARRTREIGIRLALGAQRRSLLWLVVRDAALLVGTGTVLGLAGAVALSRLGQSLVYGISPRDPIAVAVGLITLLLVTTLAVLVPAHRAITIQPNEALRHD